MDFSNTAAFLERQVRAYYPWPIAYFRWEDRLIRVGKAEETQTSNLAPGQRGIQDKFPCIGTSSNDLKLLEIQPAGKRMMSGKQFLNGARNWVS